MCSQQPSHKYAFKLFDVLNISQTIVGLVSPLQTGIKINCRILSCDFENSAIFCLLFIFFVELLPFFKTTYLAIPLFIV